MYISKYINYALFNIFIYFITYRDAIEVPDILSIYTLNDMIVIFFLNFTIKL